MGFKPGEENQSSNIRRAIEEAGLDMGTVWIAYFTMGGNAGTWEVEAYIGGAMSLPALERDILAQAINELIDDLPPRRKATFSDHAGKDAEKRGPVKSVGHELMSPPAGPGSREAAAESAGSQVSDEGSPRESAGHGGRPEDDSDGSTRLRPDGQSEAG